VTNPLPSWRAGLRPGLYGSAIVAVLFVMALPMFPEYTIVRATLELLGVVVGTFLFIVTLYATEVVKANDGSRPFNPWILGLVAVALVLLIGTECS